MKFGLSEQQIQILNELLIVPLKNLNVTVYVFGSRARGNHHPYSDLDLLLENLDSVTYLTLSNFKEQLEESKLPFKVDLVLQRDLAKSYIDQVSKEKILF